MSMTIDWEAIGSFVQSTSPWAIVLILFYLFLAHPDQVACWASNVLKFFCWLGLTVEKRYIASDIQSRIGLSAKDFAKQAPGLAPLGLKIRWVTSEDISPEAFTEGNQVIIRMQRSANQDRNFVNAAIAYTSQTVLTRSRCSVDDTVVRSIDLKLAHKIIESTKGQPAVNLFFDEVLQPQMSDDSDLAQCMRTFSRLDETGTFTRILLQELSLLWRRVPGDVPAEEVKAETKRFAREFLPNVAEKPPGREVELSFRGDYIRVGIVLVAKTETYQTRGLPAYQKAIITKFRNGADVVYLCALGRNVSLVKRLLSLQRRNPKLERLHIRTYMLRGGDGRPYPAICAGLRKKVSSVK